MSAGASAATLKSWASTSFAAAGGRPVAAAHGGAADALACPASLDELLSLLGPCFSQPSFQTFPVLLVGQVCQTGLRTVCGMLGGARLSGVWEHCRAHRFFSRARWCADELGLRIAALICERLVDPGAPLLVAIDDTLLHRLGRKVHACFWHHDATANSDMEPLRGQPGPLAPRGPNRTHSTWPPATQIEPSWQ